jgi:hypothetical protein
MPTTENRISRESLQWLTLEGAAIVVSILFAFWIDAWWDERQERKEEVLVLTSILAEFKDKRQILTLDRVGNQAMLDSAKALIDASLASDSDVDPAWVDQQLGNQWFNNNASRWTVPVLESTISAGKLDLISDADLRTKLGAWPSQFAVIRTTIGREVAFYDDYLMPYLQLNSVMPQTLNTIEHLLGFPELKVQIPKFQISQSYDHTELLASRSFQNLMTRRWVYLRDILDQEFMGLEEQMDETIAIVQSEIEKSSTR